VASLALEDHEIHRLAESIAEIVLARLEAREAGEGYLAPDAAACYLGVTRKRIYDLKSMGALEADGYDGRTPLFTRPTLDAYARSPRVAP
jgi:hypothetical protein